MTGRACAGYCVTMRLEESIVNRIAEMIAGSGSWWRCLFGVLLLASCTGVTAPSPRDGGDLAAAMRRWSLTAPSSYEVADDETWYALGPLRPL